MRARREAANEAYTTTLAPIHTYLVRAAVRTSMFLLPDRTAFLKSIGETGAAHPCLSQASVVCLSYLLHSELCNIWAWSKPAQI